MTTRCFRDRVLYSVEDRIATISLDRPDHGTVNAIEGGRMTPSILLALKLARALDVSVDELFRLRTTESEPGPDEQTKPRFWR